eukprot:TRINITY_DN3561_c0_g1_i4.p1 TRINITY_DN3561_c0_g1~~TRINITY_DN3561_c0_g1_i4.p1  ORF type:complete len:906 (-),score=199.34 TRINITY_DN3561_c0_g1_i4:21-2738(-)
MWSEDFAAISKDSLQRTVIPRDETFLNGWWLVHISKKNVEKEIIVLLSDKSIYRVNYNRAGNKVNNFSSISLADITSIQVGMLKVRGHALYHYGMRIENKNYHGDQHATNHHTYKAFNLSPLESGREPMEEIALILLKVRGAIVPNDNILEKLDSIAILPEEEPVKTETAAPTPAAQGVTTAPPRKETATQSIREINFSGEQQSSKRPIVTKSTEIPIPPKDQELSKIGSVSPVNVMRKNYSAQALNSMGDSPPGGSPFPMFNPTPQPTAQTLQSAYQPPQLNHQPAPQQAPQTATAPATFSARSVNRVTLDSLPPRPAPSRAGTERSINKSSTGGFFHRRSSSISDSSMTRPPSPPFDASAAPASNAPQNAAPAAPAANGHQNNLNGAVSPPLAASSDVIGTTSRPASTYTAFSQPTPAHAGTLKPGTRRPSTLVPMETIEEDLGSLSMYADEDHDLVYRLFHRLDAIAHFSVFVVSAYLVGVLGFSFLWVVMFLYLVYKIDGSRMQKILKLKEREWKNKKKAAVEKPETQSEDCEWLNMMMTELWKNINTSVAEATKEKLKEIVEHYLNEKKPGAVEGISIAGINFGDIPPKFSAVKATKPVYTDYQMNFDFKYQGSLKMLLEVALGGRHVNVKVPILIQDWNIKGRMRFDMDFFAKSPYLNNLTIAFVDPPHIDLSIKPMKTFDIMDMPILKQWVEESIKLLVRSTMVVPAQISLPYTSIFGTAKYADTVKPTYNTSLGHTVEKQDDQILHQEALERSKKEGDFDGLLHVRILEGRKFNSDLMKSHSTPYCILSTGSHEVFNTNPVKKAKNPQWNEFFELLVKKSNTEKKLEITVMARNAGVGDNFIGMHKFLFGDCLETKDLWIPLERRPRKEKEKLILPGELHMQIRYIPPTKPIVAAEQ